MDQSHVHSLINPADPESVAVAAQLVSHPHRHAGEYVYFPLPARYCLHVPLNPATHPLLFQLLEATHDVHKDINAALRLPPPRFSGGFDISGHAFLLTLGALILAAEVAPSWRAYRARGYTQRTGQKARLHAIATVLATALICLWVWMLLMTAIYFHDPHEKLAGLGESSFIASARQNADRGWLESSCIRIKMVSPRLVSTFLTDTQFSAFWLPQSCTSRSHANPAPSSSSRSVDPRAAPRLRPSTMLSLCIRSTRVRSSGRVSAE
jgi:hypothetical protein